MIGRLLTIWSLTIGFLHISDAVAQESRFGLDALFGVEIGMPLEEAVAVLEARGYQPDLIFLDGWEEMKSNRYMNYEVSTEFDRELGIIRPVVAIPTAGDPAPVTPNVIVSLGSSQAGVKSRVLLWAGHDPETSSGYGSGPVFSIFSEQDYTEAEGPGNYEEIMKVVLQGIGTPPTCIVSGLFYLFWVIQEDGRVAQTIDAESECLNLQAAGLMQSNYGRLLDVVLRQQLHVRPLNTFYVLPASESYPFFVMWRDDADLAVQVVSSALERAGVSLSNE